MLVLTWPEPSLRPMHFGATAISRKPQSGQPPRVRSPVLENWERRHWLTVGVPGLFRFLVSWPSNDRNFPGKGTGKYGRPAVVIPSGKSMRTNRLDFPKDFGSSTNKLKKFGTILRHAPVSFQTKANYMVWPIMGRIIFVDFWRLEPLRILGFQQVGGPLPIRR
jgi:hypothetical protein